MSVMCRNLSVLVKNVAGVRCLPSAFRSYSQVPPAELVKVEFDAHTGIAEVSLNRPPVNSLNTELLSSLGKTIKDLENDKAKGIVLTSTAETVFSAGLDIMEMYDRSRESMSEFWSTLQNTWLTLYRTPIPTAAAINGHAPAGGCLLALTCEYRVMVGPQYTIGLNETKLGIIAPPWFIICMRDTVGQRETELALTTGRMFTTEEALKIGMIDKVVSSKDKAIADAKGFIFKFAKINANARNLTKQKVREEGIKYMENHCIEDLKAFVDQASQPSVQESLKMYIQALKAKKLPKFLYTLYMKWPQSLMKCQ